VIRRARAFLQLALSERGRAHLHRLRPALDGEALAEGWVERGTGEPAAGAPDPGALREWLDGHDEGRGVVKWSHYFEAYERHLGRFRGRSPVVCEVGLFAGGSIDLWRAYFGPGCRVVGIDVDERCRAYADDSTTVFVGDQGDRAFWARVRAEAPAFDIVIDDGGHLTGQQIVTLEETLPHLRPGGVYACEDIHRAGNAFATYLRAMADVLNVGPRHKDGDGILRVPASGFQAAIHSVHLYPFLAIVEKHGRPIAELHSERHGTEWP
jgi:hypothetical protein